MKFRYKIPKNILNKEQRENYFEIATEKFIYHQKLIEPSTQVIDNCCNRCDVMNLTKSAFACSNLTKETLEQGVRYVQSLQKNKIE